MKNKRGVSPLIAWVLLISFTIAMGLLITKWVVDQIGDTEFDTDEELYCVDVSILMMSDPVRTNPGEVDFILKNNGNFRIKRISLGRETTERAEEWCLQLNIDIGGGSPFNPGTEYTHTLKIGDMQGNLVGNETTIYQMCEDVTQSAIPEEKLLSISIVPWIEIEDEPIACIDKKIVIELPGEGLLVD